MIAKVGAVILDNSGRILVVRKRVQGRHTFIIPGGRQEIGETEEQTCRRELLEELNAEVSTLEPFGVFEEPAEFDDDVVRISTFLVELSGTPVANSEIVELAWVDSEYNKRGYELGSVLTKHVIPALIQAGLMRSSASSALQQ